MSKLTYLKNFVKDRYVASIAPTSQSGVQRICTKIDFDNTKCIVEYGPGDGVITQGLLSHLPADGRLILIERNPNFVALLRRELPDPRVTVHHEDAQNVHNILAEQHIDQADYVVSGIPFSWLDPGLRDRLISQTHDLLRPDGAFLAYQTFWQPDAHLLAPLTRYFSNVHTEFVLQCIPPIRVYEARKAHKNGIQRL